MTKFAVGLAMFLVLAIGATVWMQSESTVDVASKFLKEGNYRRATKMLEEHVKDYPDDTAAILLLSEAIQSDPEEQDIRGTEKVLEVLDGIPDSAQEALIARLQQAELSIQILHEVQRAEGYARRALAVGPDDPRCSEMMSYIFQLTRRFMAAEEYYNITYENTPPHKRIDVLRRWYISQFDPFAMNTPYDEELGFELNAQTEMRRYGRFMRLEPSAPAPRAAIASRYLDEGTAPEAVDLLQGKLEGEPDEEIDTASADAFYSFQLIRGLVFMGKIEEAEQEFAAWAHPEEGHLYHRTAAMMAEQSDGDFKKAMLHYDEAAKSWPAPLDQKFHALHVACARKAGLAERAKELDADYKSRVEVVMEPVVQLGLHNAVDMLPKPEAVKVFATFYEKLGRLEDSKRWLETLKTAAPPVEVKRPPVDEGF